MFLTLSLFDIDFVSLDDFSTQCYCCVYTRNLFTADCTSFSCFFILYALRINSSDMSLS